MKLLRILTGVHAGAQLQLTPGTHRVGADDDADIRLTDWRGTDALLFVDASGVVSAQRLSAADTASAVVADASAHAHAGMMETAPLIADASARDAAVLEAPPALPVSAEEVVLLVDFVPMQFDDMILCVGPDDAAWPSDLDLLSMLLTRPAEARFAAERKKRRRYVGAVIACFVLGVVIVAGSLFTTTQMSRAALPRNADDLAQRVSQALAAAHASGLQAHAVGSTVVVSGMVTSPADDDAVRTLLARISPTGISRNYDVAQNDARSIEDSLGVQGAHVRYLGDGEFAVTGAVASRADLDSALARVRADLDPNVKNIVVQVAETHGGVASGPEPASYSEMISSDDVRYAQTPDGVKHIYVIETPASDAGEANAAGSNPGVRSTGASNGQSGAAVNANSNANAAKESIVDSDTVSRSAGGGVPLPNPATLPPQRSPS